MNREFFMINNKYLSLFSVTILFTTLHGAVPGPGAGPQVPEWFRWAAEGLDEQAQEFARRRQNQADRRQNIMDRIAALAADGIPANDPRVQNLQEELNGIRRRAEQNEQLENNVNQLAMNVAGGLVNQFNRQMDARIERENMRVQGEIDGRNRVAVAQANMNAFFANIRDPQVLVRGGLFLTGASLGIAGMYYLAKFGYAYAEANINKPSLVRETSRGGLSFTAWLMSLFNEEQEKAELTNVVLSPEIEKKVHMLADDVKQAREYGLPYQNAMFYGPPGTGKTEFARLLARYSEMDYAILSGADFSQFKGGEGITEMHKLFDWGMKSEKGLIIFIDEADACFRDRSTLDKEGVNLVNAFLSRTGSSSDKYMIVLATNYEDELDSAVRSRVHKKIPFNLPTLDERYRIIKLKMSKYIAGDKRMYQKEGQEIEASLTIARDINEEYLKLLAQKTESFSGRDLDQMVSEIRLRAYRSGKNAVTRDLVNTVFADKKTEIEKDRKTTEYQRQRAQKAREALSSTPAEHGGAIEVAAAA